ncbi:hypothetical protein [Stygiolobus caldivivus]|uniref:Uncharacterized protein n=1 Tax=Stygiolobus caldivivus TaxID=2824673 RepID=A0A8D5ZDH7_9CREN|nr:hypothetical protein [Stygiolobus caldivivus]BCU69118.1 hypothetical protein KN1_04150 [Stygiolobus caldivivus]
MQLYDYLKKRGFEIEETVDNITVKMESYTFFIDKKGNEIILPIPLPTGKETLDDLVEMGIKYARGSRIAQGLGSPLEYEIKDSNVLLKKKFADTQELEQKLIKALDGIESLRYFL